MNFYQWFNKQSTLIKVILLLIPVVNWVVELLIRGSIMLKKKSLLHIIVFALYLFVGWSMLLEIIDLVYLVLKGNLIFAK